MRPQSCKSKGRRFQQRVARTLLDAFPHLTEDDVRSTSMGAPGEDIQLSSRARDDVPLSLECKCVERLNVWQCLEQAEANTKQGAHPCLVFSRNRAKTYAVLPWDVVVDMLVARAGGGATATSPRVAALVAELHALVNTSAPPVDTTGDGPSEE